MTCRLLLDEHISLAVAEALRASGHDALSVHEAGLLGAPDDILLSLAAEQGRVFVSRDFRDCVRLCIGWNEEGRDFPGIVLVKRNGSEYSSGEMVILIERHITPDPARLQNSLTWLPPLEQ